MTYVTVNHLDDYSAVEFLRVGAMIRLKKEPANEYDDEAIAVYSGNGSKIGYTANSVSTVCRGTCSAGRVYDRFGEETSAVVRFIMVENGIAIAELAEDNNTCSR